MLVVCTVGQVIVLRNFFHDSKRASREYNVLFAVLAAGVLLASTPILISVFTTHDPLGYGITGKLAQTATAGIKRILGGMAGGAGGTGAKWTPFRNIKKMLRNVPQG